jgi:hypothetical protein
VNILSCKDVPDAMGYSLTVESDRFSPATIVAAINLVIVGLREGCGY